MALNTVVPSAGQTLAVTRDPIRNNFVSINDQFALDHYEFNSVNNGLHQKVTLPAAAAPAQVANANVIYSQTSAISGEAELVAAKQNGSAAPASCQTNEFTYATYNVIGETTLPSGIKMKWGNGTTGAGGTVTVTFANAFTTIYSAQCTAATTAPAGNPAQQIVARIDQYTNADLIVRTLRIQAAGGNPQTASFTWFAIGI